MVGGTIPWAGILNCKKVNWIQVTVLCIVSPRATSPRLLGLLLPGHLGQDGLHPWTIIQNKPFPLHCLCRGIFVRGTRKEARLLSKNTSYMRTARVGEAFTCQTSTKYLNKHLSSLPFFPTCRYLVSLLYQVRKKMKFTLLIRIRNVTAKMA